MSDKRTISLQDAFKLAGAHHRAGRPALAERLYKQILGVQPDNAAVHNNLGQALQELGKPDQAIACFRRALKIDPTLAEPHCNLGNALYDAGKIDQAVAWFRRGLKIDPNLAGAHCNLGAALRRQGKLDEAAVCYRRTLEIDPGFAKAHHNLGNVSQDEGRWEEAVAHYGRALSLDPDRAESHSSLGNALYFLGRLDEAMEHLERAVAIKPDYAAGHFNKSLADLLSGNYAEGWRGYEWRWRMKQHAEGKRDFDRPRWDGSPLEGRTILLHDEQGLGDAIHFVRYAPMVKERGGRVVVTCRPKLVRLFSTMDAIDDLIPMGDPLPAFDVYAPLMSLPGIFGTTLATIPGHVPYLAPPAEAGPALPEGPDGTRLTVGIAWAGSRTNTNDRNRSCRLRDFDPVLSVPGVAFFSLQKDEAAAELEGTAVHDLSGRLGDFADTAAVVDKLDLVLSVDTAVIHVAGALGRPVWVLVPFAPDWRWARHGDTSPWYPTVRLFRQPAPGDWASVFATVAEELGRRAA